MLLTPYISNTVYYAVYTPSALSRIPLNSHCRSTNSTKMAYATDKVRPKLDLDFNNVPHSGCPSSLPTVPFPLILDQKCVSFVTINLASRLFVLISLVDSSTYPFANAEAFGFQFCATLAAYFHKVLQVPSYVVDLLRRMHLLQNATNDLNPPASPSHRFPHVFGSWVGSRVTSL